MLLELKENEKKEKSGKRRGLSAKPPSSSPVATTRRAARAAPARAARRSVATGEDDGSFAESPLHFSDFSFFLFLLIPVAF